MEKTGLKFDMGKKADRALLGKLRRGQTVQLKKDMLEGPSNVYIGVSDDLKKKMMKAAKMGKGLRMKISPSEAETIESEDMVFTAGGRVSIGKAFKKLGKDIEKGFKTAAKGYRQKARPVVGPFMRTLVEEGIKTAGSKVMEQAALSAGADPTSAKILGRATGEMLKKPARKAAQKSGLGMNRVTPIKTMPSGMGMNRVTPIKRKPMVKMLSPMTTGTGRMLNMGAGFQPKDIYIGDDKVPIQYGGLIKQGNLLPVHSRYMPVITASTPMMPLSKGKGLYLPGEGLF